MALKFRLFVVRGHSEYPRKFIRLTTSPSNYEELEENAQRSSGESHPLRTRKFRRPGLKDSGSVLRVARASQLKVEEPRVASLPQPVSLTLIYGNWPHEDMSKREAGNWVTWITTHYQS